eukprot:5387513-Pleurochrysis_carterae.AAC.2
MLYAAAVDALCIAPQEIMKPFVEQYQDQYGITIHCSEEEEPLGTAGPIALAKSRGLLDDHE